MATAKQMSTNFDAMDKKLAAFEENPNLYIVEVRKDLDRFNKQIERMNSWMKIDESILYIRFNI